ncbi:hypothetical protein [Actinomadura rubrisoli]|uniref:Uncharacterized protein n=1 Tax=Actinomadura rubrisoli TaxID=2530368 RepID=A0A4R4ZZG1_9ACTN|nr:hypothetical protein [Actinomadura rubrisoli]TDD63549.1 hypothetical protein E1298_43740 [Actinomadura rubrisoli]
MATSQGVTENDKIIKLLLTRTLRVRGFRKLCKSEESDYHIGATNLSVNLLFSILLGLAIFATQELALHFWEAAILVTGSLFLVVIAALIIKASQIFGYILFLATWIGAGAYELWQGQTGVFWSHIFPFTLVLAVRWSWSALKVAWRVPLFIPLALILVLLPLLTEDPWRLASDAHSRIPWVAGVSIGPLAFLFIARLIRINPDEVINAASSRILSREKTAETALALIKENKADDDGELDDDDALFRLRLAFPSSVDTQRLEKTAQAARRALQLRAIRVFLVLTFGIFIALWVLIYVLAWAALPISLAMEWSKHAVPVETFDLVGVNVSLPLGPYLLVATLFACVACVGFLSFVLTEEHYYEPLWANVVEQPAEEYVLLALAYIDLADNT